MSKRRTIILNALVGVGAAGYIAATGILWSDKKAETRCEKIDVRIEATSPYDFVTDSTIKEWVAESAVSAIGSPIAEINLHSIETNIREHLFVDSVEVSSTMDGTLFVKVSQCVPMLRIKSEVGYDFYIDSTLKVLPMQRHCRADVPIVSGLKSFGFAPDYFGKLDDKINRADKEYLKNITNFVRSVHRDDFLRDLVVQIYINRSGEIELVPRVGNQIILFGDLDETTEKLDKLKKFYLNSFSQEWWAKARTVNLKYKNQVIVS